MKPFRLEFPLVTKSLNLREHHMARHRRVQSERGKLRRNWPGWDGGPLLIITLTRIAPRKLDPGDNLSSSLKAVRDEVAACLRIDDASPLVRWEYAQEKGPEAIVRVEAHEPRSGIAPEPRPVEWTEAERAELLPPPRKK